MEQCIIKTTNLESRDCCSKLTIPISLVISNICFDETNLDLPASDFPIACPYVLANQLQITQFHASPILALTNSQDNATDAPKLHYHSPTFSNSRFHFLARFDIAYSHMKQRSGKYWTRVGSSGRQKVSIS